MVTVLARNQVEIRADTDAALVVGPGTPFAWTPEGPAWWAAPQVRERDEERAGAHGVTPGRDLLGTHTATLQVYARGATQADVAARIDEWKAACAVASDELVTVRARLLTGETRVRFGRFRQVGEADATEAARGRIASCSAQFVTPDALTYSDVEQSATTGRVLPGVGVEVPFEPPFALGPSTPGAVNVVNAGSAAGFWRARLLGPLSQPVVEHLESGSVLAFTANGGVDLGVGQVLDLDSRRRSALLAGTADRLAQLAVGVNRWPPLGRGVNTFRLTGDDGAGSLTVFWRDAFNS